MFKYYDSPLSSAIQKADDMIDQIEVTSETTLTEFVAYVALGLSAFNFILCCIVCQCLARLFQRRLEAAFKEKIPPQAVVAVPPRPHKICKRCDKPVNQERRSGQQTHPRVQNSTRSSNN